MPAIKIGLNLTALDNVTPPTFSITNQTDATTLLEQVPQTANEMTGGFYGLIILGSLFGYLMWKLSQDQAFGGDYGYDYVRGIGIAASICGVIGLFCLNMGFFVNFYHVLVFIIIGFIGTGLVWKGER